VEKEFILKMFIVGNQRCVLKKDLLGLFFYQQLKKNAYFCKLNFDEKRTKNIV